MAVSKVVLGNQTVMDITDSTVDAGSLLAGKKAYGANGEPVNGSLVVSDRIRWNEAKTSVKKNLLQNKATGFSVYNLIFTVNDDGTITVNNSGSAASAQATISIASLSQGTGIALEPGDYILNGCPANGGNNKYGIYITDGTNYHYDYGEGKSFTVASKTTYGVVAFIGSGQQPSNFVFKPMIRLASIEDDTYVPYIPDNVELKDYASMSIESNVYSGNTINAAILALLDDIKTKTKDKGFVGGFVWSGHEYYGVSGYTFGSSYMRGMVYNHSSAYMFSYRIDNNTFWCNEIKPSSNYIPEFYLDQTATTSTTDPTTYTFTDARITADSVIDPYADIFGVYPSSVVASAGTCTVTFPKQDTAQSMTCRIYIK